MIAAVKMALRRSTLAGPLADTVGLCRRPQRTLRLWGDAHRTWREAAIARALPTAPRDRPRLLVLSMTDNTYTAKLECMLAFGMRRRGWRVTVLSSRFYTNARRLYAAYGIDDFLYFEDLLHGPGSNEEIESECRTRATGLMDFQSVMTWSYRDAWLGPQLLSSVSRRRFDGAPDPRDPQVRAMILEQLPISLRFVHAAELYLENDRPDAIIVNEPNYHVIGPFVDVAIARDIPVVHFTQPSREDALIFKKLTRETRRIHPNSVTPATFERLLREPWDERQDAELDEEFAQRYGGIWKVQARNQPGTKELSAAEVRELLSLDPEKPIATVFSHILWDANLFYGEDLFENYGEWFVETVRAAVANPKVNWLVKLHPANIWKRKLSGVTDEYGEIRLIRERIGELPDHVRLMLPDTPVSTLSLFRTVDLGVTVRGSIGYELPCFGVPVLTAGSGRYTGFGFTIDHESRGEYLRTLAGAEQIKRLSPEATRRARVHAHALFRRRPWTYTSFRSVIGDDVTDPLFQNLVAVETENAQFEDLGVFAQWLEQHTELDYLAP